MTTFSAWFFWVGLTFVYVSIYFFSAEWNYESKQQKVIVWQRGIKIILFQRGTIIKSTIEKRNVSWEIPIAHMIRIMFHLFWACFWKTLEVTMTLLMRIVTWSTQTSCAFYRWNMMGTYFLDQWPTIWLEFLTWHIKSKMTAPMHRGRLSTWICRSMAVIAKSFLIMYLNFVIIIITSYIVCWSHVVKVGGYSL